MVNQRTCSRCSGTGEIVKTPCKDCNGKGVKSVRSKVEVKIPAGVDTGNRIRVAGEVKQVFVADLLVIYMYISQ
mgnify:CR=1 FL=1